MFKIFTIRPLSLGCPHRCKIFFLNFGSEYFWSVFGLVMMVHHFYVYKLDGHWSKWTVFQGWIRRSKLLSIGKNRKNDLERNLKMNGKNTEKTGQSSRQKLVSLNDRLYLLRRPSTLTVYGRLL